VREDYSPGGDAWSHFSHDQARARAYRWGEDGLAGICDDRQALCFALALWNGRDPILKERLFGLDNGEGNHGEDVKEVYFYLDSTPTHSYLRCLYRYPQAAFPYEDLLRSNRERGRQQPEYELVDTGVFDGDRYFDVFVEYAKATPEDILARVTVHNRGPEQAAIHLLPTAWFHNDWAWRAGVPRPTMRQLALDARGGVVALTHRRLGERFLYAEGAGALLFTENETNNRRLFAGDNPTFHVKDGFDRCIVHGERDAVSADGTGTKVAAHYVLQLLPGESRSVRLRLTDQGPGDGPGSALAALAGPFAATFDAVFVERQREADEFYAEIVPSALPPDAQLVMRQALAGMLWSKQFFHYDLAYWLREHGVRAFRPSAVPVRNERWQHMVNRDVISMPDKWEYPWYAAWDLAFHVLPLSLVDPDFAKQQLELMLQPRYLHPSGQIPAYEWNFGDVNPPVHAWSTMYTYLTEKAERGKGDVAWLERCFLRLLLNFNWWVNRKDRLGNHAFEGGFLGLDNIGVFDRSAPLPTGGHLEQADGTAWMALFCQNMLEISAELAKQDDAYQAMTTKFAQHFLLIATGMIDPDAQCGMWDEEDGFFYDVLRLPDGHAERLKVRSMVGLLPLCAVTVLDGELVRRSPELADTVREYLERHPALTAFIHDPFAPGVRDRLLGSILDEAKLRRMLTVMLDEREFLSPYGIRSLSRVHAERPYVYRAAGQEFRVAYLPGDSDNGMFGGNSNWRGPIWMPMNLLILRALLQYYLYYGERFTVECPTGSGRQMNLFAVAREIGSRLAAIFLADGEGRRPLHGVAPRFGTDPQWQGYPLFYEYFHGDSGAGLGASHQTGWTGGIARILHLFATLDARAALAMDKQETFAAMHAAVRG
jgi:hypothetical protein